jgi:hypothetical protein
LTDRRLVARLPVLRVGKDALERVLGVTQPSPGVAAQVALVRRASEIAGAPRKTGLREEQVAPMLGEVRAGIRVQPLGAFLRGK